MSSSWDGMTGPGRRGALRWWKGKVLRAEKEMKLLMRPELLGLKV